MANISPKRKYTYPAINNGGMDIADRRPIYPSGHRSVAPMHSHANTYEAEDNLGTKRELIESSGSSLKNWSVTYHENAYRDEHKQSNLHHMISRIATRRFLLIGLIAVVLVVILAVILRPFHGSGAKPVTQPRIASNLKKPNFTPIVPAGKSQLADLGSESSFNATKDSYTFNDLLLGLPIQVSEQPLPSGYSSSASVVAALAKDINAGQTVNFKDGVAYLNSDSSTGKQTLVLSKDNLLIFIQSLNVIDINSWANYINSLN